jgi:Na+-transporting NADH:ubiquinone oxidoreductase subunit NqrF
MTKSKILLAIVEDLMSASYKPSIYKKTMEYREAIIRQEKERSIFFVEEFTQLEKDFPNANYDILLEELYNNKSNSKHRLLKIIKANERIDEAIDKIYLSLPVFNALEARSFSNGLITVLKKYNLVDTKQWNLFKTEYRKF